MSNAREAIAEGYKAFEQAFYRGDADTISRMYTEVRPAMRMSMRRFTRLTSAFIKKVKNHAAALCIVF